MKKFIFRLPLVFLVLGAAIAAIASTGMFTKSVGVKKTADFDPNYRFWIYNGSDVSGQSNASNYQKASSAYNEIPSVECEGNTVYCYIYAQPSAADSTLPNLSTINGSMSTHKDL